MAERLTPAQLVEVLRARQRAHWQAGEPILAEVYLRDHPALQGDPDCALKVVYQEWLLREQRGEAVRLEEYLRRFPQFAGQLKPLFEVHQALGLSSFFPDAGEAPEPAGQAATELRVAAPRPRVPGYEVLGELGRGGMGVVWKARDRALGRLVALKTIRGGAGDPEQVRRFRQEAALLARLRHPNIVQVYEVGEHDGLPFFALEYVEGGSLADRLSGQPLPAAVAAGLIEKLARAVQAAHRAGVVHRDLKPANVLLQRADGAVATESQAQEEQGTAPALASAEAALRVLQEAVPKVSDFGLARPLQGGAGLTASGAVLGTPEYMAPEQAQGKGREAGPGCDVYALGAILYQLLTGRPPFVGERTMDVLLQVAHDEPLPPRRLWARVPRDLETVCLRCLEKDPARRYASALALADDLARFLRGEPVWARRTSVLTRGLKWARRRPAAAALVGACVLLLALAGGAGAWYRGVRAEQVQQEAQRAARAAGTEREVTAALQEAKALGRQARRLSGSPDQWQATLKEALSAVKRAQGLAASGEASAVLREEVRRVRADLSEAERDRALIAELEDVRLLLAGRGEGGFDLAGAAQRYEAAFRDYGIDVRTVGPDETARRLRSHPLREELLAAIEDWARIAADKVEQRPLVRVLEAADPNPESFRIRWHKALGRGGRAALEKLAAEPEVLHLSSGNVVNLAHELRRIGASATAARLLREMRERHPGDFWLNFELALTCQLMAPPRLDEAIGYYRAAQALRSRCSTVYYNLGTALQAQGQVEEAIRCYHKTIDLDPKCAIAYEHLGSARREQGRLDEAIRCYRQALALDPKLAQAHLNLGSALHSRGRLGEALCCYHRALELNPQYTPAHNNLGNALREQGQWGEALCCYHRALELNPQYAPAHNNLGNALREQGQWGEAFCCYHRALELDPRDAQIHNNLGAALQNQGQLGEAVRCFRQALALDPQYAAAHNNLGNALRKQGQREEAICCFHRALTLDPRSAAAHGNLGNAFGDQGQFGEAICCYLRAVQLDPKLAKAQYGLGNALRAVGRLGEAICCYHRALDLDPKDAHAHNNLGAALQGQGQLGEAICCYYRAVALDPEHSLAHWNLGLAERRWGRFAEALASLGRARKLVPPTHPRRPGLDQLILQTEQLLELDRKLPAVRKGETKPADAAERAQMASLCQQPYKRYYAASARLYAEAFAGQPALAAAHRYDAACAAALAATGQGKDAGALGAEARAGLRRQALTWLRADLRARARLAEGGTPQVRTETRRVLAHWQQDPDLAALRDKGELPKLPAEERDACRALWADVEALGERLAEPAK